MTSETTPREAESKVTLVSTGHCTLRGNGKPFPSTPTRRSELTWPVKSGGWHGFAII